MGPRTRRLRPPTGTGPEESVTEGGWLNTRDRVSVDDHGWVTYSCRSDDIEIVGGLNVNPIEVERLIAEDDNVAEVAVVSVTESAGARALQAFLLPASGATLQPSTFHDLHRRLLTRLSAFKVPHRFAVVDRLPRTSTGKLMRSALREENPVTPIWDLPGAVPEPPASVPIVETPGGLTLQERLALLQDERHRLVVETVTAETAKSWVDRVPSRSTRT